MTAGRKPSLEHMRLVGGTDLPTPTERAAAPKPAAKRIPVPAHLSHRAKAMYRRVAEELNSRQRWQPLFQEPIAIYAEAYADWLEAKDQLKAGKILTGPNGGQVHNQWLGVRKQAWATMLRIAGDFGFTPVGEARLQGLQLDLFDQPSPADTDDPYTEMA